MAKISKKHNAPPVTDQRRDCTNFSYLNLFNLFFFSQITDDANESKSDAPDSFEDKLKSSWRTLFSITNLIRNSTLCQRIADLVLDVKGMVADLEGQ